MPFISSKRLANMEKLLRQLHERLDELTNPVEADNARNGKIQGARHIEIAIQELHVQEVKLEELAFHMDSISIDDLSGSFNLGNNFLHKQNPSATGNTKTYGNAKTTSKSASSGQTHGKTTADASKQATSSGTTGIETAKRHQKEENADHPGFSSSKNGYRMVFNR